MESNRKALPFFIKILINLRDKIRIIQFKFRGNIMNNELLIKVGGIFNLICGLFRIVFPKLFKWDENLAFLFFSFSEYTGFCPLLLTGFQ